MKGKRNSLGFKHSLKTRRKKSDFWAKNKEKHNHYIDGKGAERNSEREAAMSRLDYRLWREAVLKRDNWLCVLCGAKGDMVADHIKSWSKYPALRYDISNGRTLCPPCHVKTDNYGIKATLEKVN